MRLAQAWADGPQDGIDRAFSPPILCPVASRGVAPGWYRAGPSALKASWLSNLYSHLLN